MRCLLAITAFAAGCTGLPENGPRYDSVRERLSGVPTSLYVRDEASSGTVTARHSGHGGWRTRPTELVVQHGYVRAAVDDTGQLELDRLEIAIAPITLEGVFDKPAQLRDVSLRLAGPVRGDVAWLSADDATATLVVAFDLDCAIAFEGGDAVALATQHLSPEDIDVVVSGNGDHVELRMELEAAGTLWSWADRVHVTEVALSIAAETAY